MKQTLRKWIKYKDRKKEKKGGKKNVGLALDWVWWESSLFYFDWKMMKKKVGNKRNGEKMYLLQQNGSKYKVKGVIYNSNKILTVVFKAQSR